MKCYNSQRHTGEVTVIVSPTVETLQSQVILDCHIAITIVTIILYNVLYCIVFPLSGFPSDDISEKS